MTKIFLVCMVFMYIILPGVSTAGSLTDNGNGTVTDNGTLLTWQQEGYSSTMTWEQALAFCEALTLVQTDWRLPNIKELSSIVDDTRKNPAIDTTLFPSMPATTTTPPYWSSTTCADATSSVWRVNFYNGGTEYGSKTPTFYVRCVRGGQ